MVNILVVAASWNSLADDLCGINLNIIRTLLESSDPERLHHDIYMTSVDATNEEVKEAIYTYDVTLFRSRERNVPIEEQTAAYYEHLTQIPSFNCIIGYAPKTHSLAVDILSTYFNNAKLILIMCDTPTRGNSCHGRIEYFDGWENSFIDAAKRAVKLYSMGHVVHDFFQKELKEHDLQYKHRILLPRPNIPLYQIKSTKNKPKTSEISLPTLIDNVDSIPVHSVEKAVAAIDVIACAKDLLDEPIPAMTIFVHPTLEKDSKEHNDISTNLQNLVKCSKFQPRLLSLKQRSELVQYLVSQESMICIFTSPSHAFETLGLELIAHEIPLLVAAESGLGRYLIEICGQNKTFIIETVSTDSGSNNHMAWKKAILDIPKKWHKEKRSLNIKDKTMRAHKINETLGEFINDCYGSIAVSISSGAVIRPINLPQIGPVAVEDKSSPAHKALDMELNECQKRLAIIVTKTKCNALERINENLSQGRSSLKMSDIETEMKLLTLLSHFEGQGSQVLEIQKGSVILKIRCPNERALNLLWQDYKSGRLRAMFEHLMVSPEMLNRLEAIGVKFNVDIKEDEYISYKNYLQLCPVQDYKNFITNGKVLLEREEYRNALKHFQKALLIYQSTADVEDYEDLGEIYFGLSKASYSMGRYLASLNLIDAYIDLMPSHFEGYLQRALCAKALSFDQEVCLSYVLAFSVLDKDCETGNLIAAAVEACIFYASRQGKGCSILLEKLQTLPFDVWEKVHSALTANCEWWTLSFLMNTQVIPRGITTPIDTVVHVYRRARKHASSTRFLLQMTETGFDLEQFVEALDTNYPVMFYEILQMKGRRFEVFDAVFNKLGQNISHLVKGNPRGTLLHLLCEKIDPDSSAVKFVLDKGHPTWIWNSENKSPYELCTLNSRAQTLVGKSMNNAVIDMGKYVITDEIVHKTIDQIEDLCQHGCLRQGLMAMLGFVVHNFQKHSPLMDFIEKYLSRLTFTSKFCKGFEFTTRTYVEENMEIIKQITLWLWDHSLYDYVYELLGGSSVETHHALFHEATASHLSLAALCTYQGRPEEEIINWIDFFVKRESSMYQNLHSEATLLQNVIALKRYTLASYILGHSCLVSDWVKPTNADELNAYHYILRCCIEDGEMNFLNVVLSNESLSKLEENTIDVKGNSLYHVGILHEGKLPAEDVINILSQHDMNPEKKNKAGQTPRDLTQEKSDAVKRALLNAIIKHRQFLGIKRRRRPRKLTLVFPHFHTVQPVETNIDRKRASRTDDNETAFSVTPLTQSKKKMLLENIKQNIGRLEVRKQHDEDRNRTADETSQVTKKDVRKTKLPSYPTELSSQLVHMLSKQHEPLSVKIKLLEFLSVLKTTFKNADFDTINESQITDSPSRYLLWKISPFFSTQHSTTSLLYQDTILCLQFVNEDHREHSLKLLIKALSISKTYLYKKMLAPLESSHVQETSLTKSPRLYTENEDSVTKNRVPLLAWPNVAAQDNTMEKFFPLNSEMISNIENDVLGQCDVPFSCSDKEFKIIHADPKPPCATLLLGRSGTGKTTCCIRRIWEKFISYWKNSQKQNFRQLLSDRPMYQTDEFDQTDFLRTERDVHLHQVFLTKNAVLASEVETLFDKYRSTYEFFDILQALDDQQPSTFNLNAIPDSRYPLFATSRRFLLMLDASLPGEKMFIDLDNNPIHQVKGWTFDEHLTTLFEDDVDDDADLANLLFREFDKNVPTEITYDIFCDELWPKIKHKIECDKLQPTLVWTEMMSFIKGSVEALKAEDGYLSLNEYKQLGRKRAPMFDETQRDFIYKAFDLYRYERQNSPNKWFDYCDVVRTLYGRLKMTSHPSFTIHEMYIDETQDFTQAELYLLIEVCRSPNHIFLTGDTAQTIMKGISFRFEDLRTMFYEAKKTKKCIPPCNDNIAVPNVQVLVENYRSHSGILDMAAGVITVLSNLFPESFDREIPREYAPFQGPKPIFASDTTSDVLGVLLYGNANLSSSVELGANQAILVVSDKARDELPDSLRSSIVLTIYEAKGLEFEDVLLYNFFKDSVAGEKEWNTIYGEMNIIIQQYRETATTKSPVIEIQADSETSGKETPKSRHISEVFDKSKHQILSYELKQLYTAITRAKNRLWIYDECPGKHAAIFEFFQACQLVEKLSIDIKEDIQIPEKFFVRESTDEEWVSRGDYFMKKGFLKMALQSYQRANHETRTKMAKLYIQVQEMNKSNIPPKTRREAYFEMSSAFLDVDLPKQAASCLLKAGEYTLAADIYCNLQQFLKAAPLYKRKGDMKNAADCYRQAHYFRTALQIYETLHEFDEAVSCLDEYHSLLNDTDTDSLQKPLKVQNTARYNYLSAEEHFRNNELTKMKQSLKKLQDKDERIHFLTTRGLIKEAIQMISEDGDTTTAAKLALKHNLLEEALAISSGEVEDKELRLKCIIAYLRKYIKESNMEKGNGQLFKEADALTKSLQSAYFKAEILLLKGISRQHAGILNEARKAFQGCGPGYEIGVVITQEELMKYSPTLNTWNCRVVVRSIHSLITLLTALQDPRTNSQKESVRITHMFLDIERGALDQLCKIGRNSLLWDIIDENQQQRELEINTIHTKLVKVYHGLLEKWGQRVQLYIDTQIENCGPCTVNNAGYICDKTPHRHDTVASEEFIRELIFNMCTKIMMECISMTQSRIHMWPIFENPDRARTVFDGVEQLYNCIYPLVCNQRLISQNHRTANEFLRTIRLEHVTNHIKEYAKHLWETDPTPHNSNTTLFLKVVRLLELVDANDTLIDKFLSQTERDYKQLVQTLKRQRPERIPRQIGLLYNNGNFYSMMRSVLKMWSSLYRFAQPVTCLKYYYRFLLQTIRRGQSLAPKPEDLLPDLEFLTVLVLSINLRHGHTTRRIVLPASFLARVHYVDSVRVREETKLGMYDVIEYIYKLPNGNTRSAINEIMRPMKDFEKDALKLLTDIHRLLLGKNNEQFNILENVFSDKDAIENGLAERAFIYFVTILANGVSPAIEYNIRRAIGLLKIPQSGPKRLLNAFSQFKGTYTSSPSYDGVRKVCAILRDLLDERNNENLYQCHWQTKSHAARVGLVCEPNLNLEQISNSFLNPDIIVPESTEFHSGSLEQVTDGTKIIDEFEGVAEDQDEELLPSTLAPVTSAMAPITVETDYGKLHHSAILITKCIRKVGQRKRNKDPDVIYTIDSTMCKICNVSFVKSFADEDVIPIQTDDETEDGRILQPTLNAIPDSTLLYAEHIRSDKHKITQQHFEKYASLMKRAKPVFEAANVQIAGIESDLSHATKKLYDLEQLKRKYEYLKAENHTIQQYYTWDRTEKLELLVKDVHRLLKQILAQNKEVPDTTREADDFSSSTQDDFTSLDVEIPGQDLSTAWKRPPKLHKRKYPK